MIYLNVTVLVVLHLCPDWHWDTPSLLSSGNRDAFPWGKLLVVKAEHAFPSRADVKNEWSSTSNTSYVVMAWTGQLYLPLC